VKVQNMRNLIRLFTIVLIFPTIIIPNNALAFFGNKIVYEKITTASFPQGLHKSVKGTVYNKKEIDKNTGKIKSEKFVIKINNDYYKAEKNNDGTWKMEKWDKRKFDALLGNAGEGEGGGGGGGVC
jgi:hypothetical protein